MLELQLILIITFTIIFNLHQPGHINDGTIKTGTNNSKQN